MTTDRFEYAILGTIYSIIGTFLEDKDTKKEMGEVYQEYSKNVPLLIPRLTPWREHQSE